MLLELTNIKRQFKMGETTVQALNGVTVNIAQGESVAVWGPSGSGKSTLMNLLGLIDVPDSGKMNFDGVSIDSLSDKALTDYRNKKIGFVFQSFNLIPVLSAKENVMLPLQVRGASRSDAAKCAESWLDRVGLKKFYEFRPDRLSGGQRQRVAIARALVTEPMLVIADEPTANLDSTNSRSIIDLLRDMNELTGVTCVFSTHDPRLLERIPRHLHLEDGKITEDKRLGA